MSFGGANWGGAQWTVSLRPFSDFSGSSPGDQCADPTNLLKDILLSKLFLSIIKLFSNIMFLALQFSFVEAIFNILNFSFFAAREVVPATAPAKRLE